MHGPNAAPAPLPSTAVPPVKGAEGIPGASAPAGINGPQSPVRGAEGIPGASPPAGIQGAQTPVNAGATDTLHK